MKRESKFEIITKTLALQYVSEPLNAVSIKIIGKS